MYSNKLTIFFKGGHQKFSLMTNQGLILIKMKNKFCSEYFANKIYYNLKQPINYNNLEANLNELATIEM